MLARTPPDLLLDLNQLIDWLKTKPKRHTYDYMDCENCLLAQYFTDHGCTDVNIGGTLFSVTYAGKHYKLALPQIWNEIACSWPLASRTYGGALKRARWRARSS